jgi:hypothetical protein
MPSIGNANAVELTRLAFAVLAIAMHVALAISMHDDLVVLRFQGVENGRVIQARGDVISQCVLLVIQVVIAAVLLYNSVAVPTRVGTLSRDIVLNGAGYLLVQALLTYLAIHKYRTRAMALGKVMRWTPWRAR